MSSVLPWPAASLLSRLPHPAVSAGLPGGTSSPLCQVKREVRNTLLAGPPHTLRPALLYHRMEFCSLILEPTLVEKISKETVSAQFLLHR